MGDNKQNSVADQSAKKLKAVVVRFAGDSGDGIQVAGGRFADESALVGNDLAILPDFPAEIRAPAGTLAGVSSFQIQFGSTEIFTPGDRPDALVVMNPAALKAHIDDLRPGGVLLVNEDSFTEKNLSKVGYESNPCDDKAMLEKYDILVVPITKLTVEALSETGLSSRDVERCKNFFTLGIVLTMYNRVSDSTVNWIEKKFARNPEIAEANVLALKGGANYAFSTQVLSRHSYEVAPAKLEKGSYRDINGNTALAYGLISAAQKSGLPLFFAAYPITPASDLLHELSRHKYLGVITAQLEDEIAAVTAAIGAAYAGNIGVTGSSGPGIALKAEALGLAVMTELPLVVINVQRGGPSTGLPTKTEQSDLFQAIFGRHGEAPMCVLAASSPKTAFTMGYEACRIALKYMTPVMLLSDGYVALCTEPWKVPDPKTLPEFTLRTVTENNNPDGAFLPYKRDEETLARPWALPGTPGLMHRIGGLEKENITGEVCYRPENHQEMTNLRAEKIQRIAAEYPPIEIDGDPNAELLVLGWGSTEGALTGGVRLARSEGYSVSRVHLNYLWPLPNDLERILKRFKKVLIPEINTGQLRSIIRDKYLIDAQGLNLVRGLPLKISEVYQAISALLES